MPASLCIHILSASQATGEEIRFFNLENRNAESEKQVMAKIQPIRAAHKLPGTTIRSIPYKKIPA
jgi:hypothetical protein